MAVGPLSEEERKEMAAAINEVNGISSSDGFVDALDEARVDPSALSELREDPQGYFARRGIVVPEGIEIEFSEPSSYRVCYYRMYAYLEVYECFTVSM